MAWVRQSLTRRKRPDPWSPRARASSGRPWHDYGVSVVIALAAVVILAGVVAVALGHGGELARERPPEPSATDFRVWSDVATYRPPAALLGYDAAATEHALAEIARAMAERDAEIGLLRSRLAAHAAAVEHWQAPSSVTDQGFAE